MNPPAPVLNAILATFDRRAEQLDAIRKALEELQAEGPAPCCHRGCAGCEWDGEAPGE